MRLGFAVQLHPCTVRVCCCSSQQALVRLACMHAVRDTGPNLMQVVSSESQKALLLRHILTQLTGINAGPCAAVAQAQKGHATQLVSTPGRAPVNATARRCWKCAARPRRGFAQEGSGARAVYIPRCYSLAHGPDDNGLLLTGLGQLASGEYRLPQVAGSGVVLNARRYLDGRGASLWALYISRWQATRA